MRFSPVTGLAALVLLALALPLAAEEEKPVKKAKAEAEEKRVVLGTLLGVVKSVGESTDELTIEVTLRYLEANPAAQADYLRQAQQLVARQAAIMRTPNPAQRMHQLQQLYRDAIELQKRQANLFRIKEVKQKLELHLAEDVKVRTVNPPEAFDDKGNIKRYTPKELKELKGDPKLPGYKADRDSIEVGCTVLVQVGRKAVPPPARKKKGKAKDKAEEAESTLTKEKPADSNKLLALLVVVGAEPMK
jgi:hypothetical protein